MLLGYVIVNKIFFKVIMSYKEKILLTMSKNDIGKNSDEEKRTTVH
jgi:hypothetical protein